MRISSTLNGFGSKIRFAAEINSNAKDIYKQLEDAWGEEEAHHFKVMACKARRQVSDTFEILLSHDCFEGCAGEPKMKYDQAIIVPRVRNSTGWMLRRSISTYNEGPSKKDQLKLRLSGQSAKAFTNAVLAAAINLSQGKPYTIPKQFDRD